LTKSIVAFFVISLCSVTFSGAFANSAHAAVYKASFNESSHHKSKNHFTINPLLIIVDRDAIVTNNPYSKKPTTFKPSQKSTGNASLASYEEEAVSLLNAARKAHGLAPLKVDMALTRLAEDYAQDMIAHGFFAHENPEGLSPFDRMDNAGIDYRWAGENLAINASVAAAQNAFMASAGHRANILNSNFTHVGIGVKRDAHGSFYVVQEFVGI
jgi:uncharacterized protein YkwD